MLKHILRTAGIFFALIAIAFVANSTTIIPRANAAPDFATDRYIVKAKSAADVASLSADLTAAGSKVNVIAPALNLMVVSTMGKTSQAALAADARVVNAGRDQIQRLVRPSMQKELFGKAFTTERKLDKIKVNARPNAHAPDFAPLAFAADPSFNFGGLMWSMYAVGAPKVWSEFDFTGTPEVLAGVADTGLDYTHIDLADNVVSVQDFTYLEDPFNLCTLIGGFSDQDLANQFGGPANGDWNGHGSWIGGNIAGVANGTGINGLAPSVKLVALKISGWCGAAWDSEIMAAMITGADMGVDVINISFGGYLDRSDPQANFIWNQYRDVVRYSRTKGTAIVSAAGNEHVRIGKQGKVLSHGSLTTPGDDLVDLFGLYENPAGIPGVVMVSSLGNIVNASSASCPPGTEGSSTDFNATCKPLSDAHQQTGVNRASQLSYFSNYGPRVDVSAPGGARKFNLPYWDRGGTPGFPYTDADGTNVWESFSTTSNWALEIPCFDLSDLPGFTSDCYTSIQGTSMASPHAAGVLALIISARPDLRKTPKALIQQMESTAVQITRSRTRVLSATDTSAADLTGDPCPTGYCHLGGDFVSDSDAYGKGMVNAYNGVQ